MIANAKIISTGINLDDTDGRFPRLCLMSPNYSAMDTHQMGFRFRRITSRSNSSMWIVMCKDFDEFDVVSKLLAKSKIMSEFSNRDVVFPSHYTTLVEL